MRSIHDRSFFSAWQMLYSASNPGRDKDRWIVDEVHWVKERHAYWGTNYSVQLEVHQLEAQRKTKWKILIVVERWWGDDKTECIKDQIWCKLVEGHADLVLAWLRRNTTQTTDISY